ncbi:gamma-glutamyltranspeptidase [Xylaria bambusicola]|uniref:gamma-glutamyltranspeptidase n=1 Tax=Xylaria bambusicola TaxID=326684 RepID=UPI0020075438|nr:gamma-glutamyltranspeptidase [Xylaria bambusicola]KAI0505303.1 gamma-glutamyltranspeptidase [Xylaria bambusicola]
MSKERLSSLPQSLLLLLLTATPSLGLPRNQWESQDQVVLESSTPGRRGAVASESKVCSQIGIDLLARGGNAVDAFIGTQLCVGVIGMYHSGLGGGGFALVRDQNGEYTVIDYRETAPAAAFEDMYRDNVNGSIFGGLAAGVPGELRGLQYVIRNWTNTFLYGRYAHNRFGSLPWYDVVYPASLVARDGFTVTPDTVRYMEFGVRAAGWNFLVEEPSWAQDFAPNGTLVKLGETMYRKRYAKTLQRVAEEGADVFYTGDIAEDTIATIQSGNGTMTLADLAEYKVIPRQPVNITYRDFTIYASGAPTSGAVSLSTLKTMEGYHDKADANLTMHRFDEAMRFAYGARQGLGDPAFVEETYRLENHMLDASSAVTTRSHILDNSTQPVENYAPGKIYTTPGEGTSHITTADGSGMAVSSTTTVNLLFGNLQMVPSTGIILNNEMNDFSIPGVRNEFGFEPAVANFIRAGKRPLSSITPLMIARADGTGDEELFAVVGAAGGSRIISSTTQVAWRVLDNLTMAEAIALPRVHDQLMPNTAVLEEGFDTGMAASLADRGHNVTWVELAASSVQGVRVRSDGVFEAASETRQVGSGGLTI